MRLSGAFKSGRALRVYHCIDVKVTVLVLIFLAVVVVRVASGVDGERPTHGDRSDIPWPLLRQR